MLMTVLKSILYAFTFHSFIYLCTQLSYAKNKPEFLALKGLHSNWEGRLTTDNY